MGKTGGIQQRNSLIASNMKSDRLTGLIAQGSPSTQDDSLRRTISSKDNKSIGIRSDENLPGSPVERMATNQTDALQVIDNLEFESPMQEMTRRW